MEGHPNYQLEKKCIEHALRPRKIFQFLHDQAHRIKKRLTGGYLLYRNFLFYIFSFITLAKIPITKTFFP